MPMPPALLLRAKDLLLYAASDTGLDATLRNTWDDIRDQLCREYDLFFTTVTVGCVAGQSIYSAPSDVIRITSVAYQGTTLGFTDRGNLDLLNPDWELEPPSTPRLWIYNVVPGDIQTPAVTITPREFVIYPAPDGQAANGAGLQILYARSVPDVPPWMEPILFYATVASVAQGNPNVMQPEKALWFQQLADLWRDQLPPLLQV